MTLFRAGCLMETERYLSVAELAERFSVRTETILRWIHSNKISATTLRGGHYRVAEREINKVLKPVGKGTNGN